MPKGFHYIVRRGDSLSAIAKRYGVPSWKKIYYHDKNEDFRDLRPDPNRIFQGDKVWLPGVVPNVASAPSGKPVRVVKPRKPKGIKIELAKIETTEAFSGIGPPPFRDDDDFTSLLGEMAVIHLRITNLPKGFNGDLQLDIGRLTNKPDKAATKKKNESRSLVARLKANCVFKGEPTELQLVWDGKATTAVSRQFSNRTTQNTNTSSSVNIPMESIGSGADVSHGLYAPSEALLVEKSRPVAIQRFDGHTMSVPILVNLVYNGNWTGNLRSYGLSPFRAEIENALLKFGGRDYMVRDGNVANRMNVRYISDSSISNSDSMRVNIGGTRASLFGSTPDGPSPLSDNIYAIHKGIKDDIDVFPGTFMLFNNYTRRPRDQRLYRRIFSPLGVESSATSASPGTATPRSVSFWTGSVSGACTADDYGNVTVTIDDDGMASVTSTNRKQVPKSRAADIQRALRAFVRMVGNTINHEVAHGLGVASRVRANNKITIGSQTVTSPLNGDGGAHNRTTNNTNIVDSGSTRSFERRVEATGSQQKFSNTNARYMRDCIPFDLKDD